MMEKGLIRAGRDERATVGFRYFLLISLVAITAILLVSGLGLRTILRDFVIMEAEDDAIRISAGIRDREMARFIRLTSDGRYELDSQTGVVRTGPGDADFSWFLRHCQNKSLQY